VESLAEAVTAVSAEVGRRVEEKAAAARAADELRRKAHLDRVRRDLSEAAQLLVSNTAELHAMQNDNREVRRHACPGRVCAGFLVAGCERALGCG
jgi:hypothetical protein